MEPVFASMWLYTANKFGVSVLWDDPDTSTPLDDMQKVFDKALEDQNTVTDIWLDDAALKGLYQSKQVRGQYAFDNKVTAQEGVGVPTLDFDKAAQVVKNQMGCNPPSCCP